MASLLCGRKTEPEHVKMYYCQYIFIVTHLLSIVSFCDCITQNRMASQKSFLAPPTSGWCLLSFLQIYRREMRMLAAVRVQTRKVFSRPINTRSPWRIPPARFFACTRAAAPHVPVSRSLFYSHPPWADAARKAATTFFCPSSRSRGSRGSNEASIWHHSHPAVRAAGLSARSSCLL